MSFKFGSARCRVACFRGHRALRSPPAQCALEVIEQPQRRRPSAVSGPSPAYVRDMAHYERLDGGASQRLWPI